MTARKLYRVVVSEWEVYTKLITTTDELTAIKIGRALYEDEGIEAFNFSEGGTDSITAYETGEAGQ